MPEQLCLEIKTVDGPKGYLSPRVLSDGMLNWILDTIRDLPFSTAVRVTLEKNRTVPRLSEKLVYCSIAAIPPFGVDNVPLTSDQAQLIYRALGNRIDHFKSLCEVKNA